MLLHGGCHCGKVRFNIQANAPLQCQQCNCSICRAAGFIHLILPLAGFTLLSGADSLSTYTFNTHIAQHTFCRFCGIKPFYTPRSNPQGIDINVNCLDLPLPGIQLEAFDGINWEQNAHTLATLSDTKAIK